MFWLGIFGICLYIFLTPVTYFQVIEDHDISEEKIKLKQNIEGICFTHSVFIIGDSYHLSLVRRAKFWV